MSARIKPAPPPRVAQLVKALRESESAAQQEEQEGAQGPSEREAHSDSATEAERGNDTGPEQGPGQDGSGSVDVEDPRAKVKIIEKAPCDRLDDLSEVAASAPDELVRVVEGLIFASPEALHVREAVEILADFEPEAVRAAFKVLAEGRPGSGLQLSRSSKGYRWTTDPAHARYVQRLVMAKPQRLSRPQLETLAVIAYRQPVTRPEIDHIRGVDSAATLKALLERDLIAVVGQSADPGRPRLYGTTLFFLEYLNITELGSLPPLGELRELSERTRELLRSKVGVDEAERLSSQVLAFAQQEDAGLEPRVVDPDKPESGEIAFEDQGEAAQGLAPREEEREASSSEQEEPGAQGGDQGPLQDAKAGESEAQQGPQSSEAQSGPAQIRAEAAAEGETSEGRSGVDATPSEELERSSEDEASPSEDDLAPSEELERSSEEEAGPSEDDLAPSEELERSSEEEAGPSEEPELSSEEEAAPSEELEAASEEEAGPSGELEAASEELEASSEEEAAPSEELEAASEEEAGPSEEEAGPSEELEAASEEEAGPSEELEARAEANLVRSEELKEPQLEGQSPMLEAQSPGAAREGEPAQSAQSAQELPDDPP